MANVTFTYEGEEGDYLCIDADSGNLQISSGCSVTVVFTKETRLIKVREKKIPRVAPKLTLVPINDLEV